jgi:rhodanese-related sulfurtransferase
MFSLFSSLFGAGKYDTLSGRQFKDLFKTSAKSAVLLDVRTPAEYRSGTLPKAINVDVTAKTFADQLAKLDKSKTYFVFCRSGGRSASACSKMSREGFKVYNLSGGIGAWPS